LIVIYVDKVITFRQGNRSKYFLTFNEDAF
jgi:hypothetical protein